MQGICETIFAAYIWVNGDECGFVNHHIRLWVPVVIVAFKNKAICHSAAADAQTRVWHKLAELPIEIVRQTSPECLEITAF